MIRRVLVLVVVLICCFQAVSVSAFAEDIHYNLILQDERPSLTGFSQADLIWSRSPSGVYVGDDLKGDVPFTVSYGHLTRMFDGVDYSLDTTTYTLDYVYDFDNVQGLIFDFPVRDVFNSYVQEQFDYLQLNFAFNFYNSVDAVVNLSRVDSSISFLRRSVNQDNSSDIDYEYPYYHLDLPLDIVMSYNPTSKSTFYVFSIFCRNQGNFFISDDTLIHIELELDPVHLIDFDMGSYFSYIGYGRLVEFYPPQTLPDYGVIWPDNDPLPQVTLPDNNYDFSIEDAFVSINSSLFLTALIIPAGVIGLGFFAFKIIIWK